MTLRCDHTLSVNDIRGFGNKIVEYLGGFMYTEDFWERLYSLYLQYARKI